jgi:hypothetical protein
VVSYSIGLSARELLLSTADTRNRRPLILLVVLLCHVAVVSLVVRAGRQLISRSPPTREPFLLLLLPTSTHNSADIKTSPHAAAKPTISQSKGRSVDPAPEQDDAVTILPKELTPHIDWEKEAEIATADAVTNAESQNANRNLSALSPAQLSWIRQNHLEPAAPGIPWKYRRVEVAEGGFPIIHINDHCVAIPFLMMMVFCKIGHIEPKGDLFDHMRDTHTP